MLTKSDYKKHNKETIVENIKKNLLLYKDNFIQILSITVDFIYDELSSNERISEILRSYNKLEFLNNNIEQIKEDSNEMLFESKLSTANNYNKEKLPENNIKINVKRIENNDKIVKNKKIVRKRNSPDINKFYNITYNINNKTFLNYNKNFIKKTKLNYFKKIANNTFNSHIKQNNFDQKKENIRSKKKAQNLTVNRTETSNSNSKSNYKIDLNNLNKKEKNKLKEKSFNLFNKSFSSYYKQKFKGNNSINNCNKNNSFGDNFKAKNL